MALCRECWRSRFFKYCGAEAMFCDATRTIISIEQAEDDTECDFYEHMDCDDSTD